MLSSLNALLVFPLLLFASNKFPNQAIADLSHSESGFEVIQSGSSVIVDNGVVSYNIQFNLNIKSKEVLNTLLPDGYNNCTEGGMFYHLDVGECATDSVSFGSNCNGCLGHYDPFGICGDDSNNTLCNPSGCLPTASNEGRICTPDTFAADPYRNCEVGDWSGKYGLALVNNTNSTGLMKGGGQSFYEVVPGDILSNKMSVVFHCNNGQRAFCKSFDESGDVINSQVPPQANGPSLIIADFSNTLGKIGTTSSALILTNEGQALYQLFGAAGKDGFDFAEDLSCYEEGLFDVTIWTTTTKSKFVDNKSLFGPKCGDALRSQWDINAQCESIFSTKYSDGLCSKDLNGDIAVCGNSNIGNYECDWKNNNFQPIFPRYTCAPGDLSGKFGQYNIKSGLLQTFEDTTSLIPNLNDLIPTSSGLATAVAIHCPIKDTVSPKDDVEFLVCAEWSETV